MPAGGGRLRLVAPSRLDIREVATTRTGWMSALDAAPSTQSVEVDLDGTEIDGAGLQLLVSLSVGLIGRGSALRLVGASPELEDQLHALHSRLDRQARG